MMPPSQPCVLMTADAVGGVWVFATALARALARDGYRVHLVVLGPPPSRERLDTLGGSERIEVEITGLALEWLDPEGEDLERALARLAAIERRVRPDLVHLNSFREATAAWRAPVLLTAHSCVWSWWRACRSGAPSEPRWLIYRKHVEAGLAAAAAWIAPTEALREEIRSIYAPPTPSAVIWNGIERIEPGDKQPVILAAGRFWDEAKNIGGLADAAEHLDWPIRIAGPVRSEDATARFETGRLRMLGALTRAAVIAQMQRAAIFAAPARYEPFGLAVLEAAAAGCALLLADIASFRELWSGAARFVDPRDPAAIRAGLEELCRDDGRRRALQHAAHDRARRYSLAAATQKYRRAYEAVLAASRSRAQPAEDSRTHAEASA
jgi:glycosyltransferase involved in cell wall biosynthesis